MGVKLAKRVALYHTLQISSPPTPCRRAARSVIKPFEVLTMQMPRPLWTLGMSSLRA